jgi:XTP/dITP diphosphohydrolase
MIVAATNNKGKLREISEILGIEVMSLAEAGINSDPDEDGASLKENAFIKAAVVKVFTDNAVLADDTGLFIAALDGAPGIHSARFDKPGHRREKVLTLMEKKGDRSAYFETVLCFIDEDVHFFTGRVDGVITRENRGDNGFGYDSIFEYNGKTFAEMTDEQKNEISHRKRAIQKLKEYLEGK